LTIEIAYRNNYINHYYCVNYVRSIARAIWTAKAPSQVFVLEKKFEDKKWYGPYDIAIGRLGLSDAREASHG
jgi:hypothetical protein